MCKLESSNMVYLCRMNDYIVGSRLKVVTLIFLYTFFFLSLYYMLTLKICVGVFSEIFKACWKNVETWYTHVQWVVVLWNLESYSLLVFFPLFVHFYPVFFVFVCRLFRIHVTIFFATYLLLLLYSSALLKQCSGAIVRFSDSSSSSCICPFFFPSLLWTMRFFNAEFSATMQAGIIIISLYWFILVVQWDWELAFCC